LGYCEDLECEQQVRSIRLKGNRPGLRGQFGRWITAMDKVTLVKSDIDISAHILDALSRTRIPVTFCGWRYVEQLEEWQLVIATPWLDEKGPRTSYRAVIDALIKAGVYEDAPMRRIFIMSPTDPVVQRLERSEDKE
jgi:hypothetical protein